MILVPFNELPEKMQNKDVKKYYDKLDRKRSSLVLKRIFDIVMSIIMIVLLFLPMVVIGVLIKLNSKGPVFYKQERVTQYDKTFKILKFRTMTVGADKVGALVTSSNDSRITSIGEKLRHYRLDELPQVFHVLSGKMSFVGTRPEVRKYVDAYTDEMLATLLLPAGITSYASIKFKDEDEIIGDVSDPDEVDRIYIEEILPKKMKFNLRDIYLFGFRRSIRLMFLTVKEVFS